MAVQKEQEGLLVFVLVMGADKDAKNQGVTKVPRAALPTVRLMVEGGGASTWVALKVLRGRRIFASHMVEADDVGFLEVAQRLHEVNQGFALGMAGEKGVRWKVAHAALKDRLVCAYLMVVVVVASSLHVLRVLRGVPCFARLMAVENDVFLLGVPKGLKGAHHCAKDMAGESVASTTVVAFVPRVCMEAPTFVLLMEVGRGV